MHLVLRNSSLKPFDVITATRLLACLYARQAACLPACLNNTLHNEFPPLHSYRERVAK